MVIMEDFKKRYSRLFTNDWDVISPTKIRDLIAITSYFIDCNTPQKILDDINVLQHAMLTYQMYEAYANHITRAIRIEIPREFHCRVENLPDATPFTFAPTFTLPKAEPVELQDNYIRDFAEMTKDVDFCSILLYIHQKGKELFTAK
ncbi:MAG: hypothetical protein K6G90_08020 [Clostridia bacterium]|nr:hypothetical protein [Clostridia bacterium]